MHLNDSKEKSILQSVGVTNRKTKNRKLTNANFYDTWS